jgi:hypothetical protein
MLADSAAYNQIKIISMVLENIAKYAHIYTIKFVLRCQLEKAISLRTLTEKG